MPDTPQPETPKQPAQAQSTPASPPTPTRRQFIRGAVTTTAYAAPVVVALGSARQSAASVVYS